MKFAEQIRALTIDQKKAVLIALQRIYLPDSGMDFASLDDPKFIDMVIAYLFADSQADRDKVLDVVHGSMVDAMKNIDRIASQVSLLDLDLEMKAMLDNEHTLDLSL